MQQGTKIYVRNVITKNNDLTYKKAGEIARTEEVTQAQLGAMHTSVPPTQVDSRSGIQNKSIKSDTPRTDRLGTRPDVNDGVTTSDSETNDSYPAV